MADSIKIANLQIEVSDNSATAVTSLSKFIETLQAVKSATNGDLGLKNVATGLKQVGDAVRDNSVFETLAESMAKATGYAERLSTALSSIATTYKSIGNGKGFQSMAKTAQKMQEQANSALTSSGRSAVSQGDVDSNASGITRLKEESDRLRDSLINAFDYLKNVQMNDRVSAELKAMADEAVRTNAKAHKLETAISKIGSAVSVLKGTASQVIGSIIPSGLARIISQLGRMMRMKALRLIVGSLIQGFKQGLQNVYYWAKATGDQFAVSMDTISTSMNYAKNSIGAAFSSILNLVAPHIDNLIDILVTGINYINMFFAALGGQSTYTKAKKVATEFGTAATGALGGAAGAARELKEELSVLDFDELNQLQAQPTSSGGSGGGGGGGTPATDYADMFEKANIEDNFLTRTAGWLRENFEDVLDIVKAIGAGILAWKIASAFSDNIKALTGLQKLGFATLTIGVVLSYQGGYEIGRNGFTVKGIVESLVGVGLAAIGGTLMWGAAGAIVGVTVAVVANIIGYVKGDREITAERWLADLKDRSVTYTIALDGLDDANQKLTTAQELLSSIKSRSIEADTELNKIAIGQALLDQIAEFEGKVNLSAQDILKLNGLTEAYNQLGLTDVVNWWQDVNGVVHTNVNEIQKAIDKYKEYATIAAYQNLLTQATIDQATAKAEMDNVTPQMNAYQTRYDQLWGQLQAYIGANYEGNHAIERWQAGDNPLGNAMLFKDQTLFDLMTEINAVYETGGTYREAYDTAAQAFSDAGTQVDYFAEQLGIATGNLNDFSDSIPKETQQKIDQTITGGLGIAASLPLNNTVPSVSTPTATSTPQASVVANTIVTTQAYKADTRGLDSATYSTYQYSGAVQSVYTAEDRARAYQIAYDQGFTDIADSIRRGGEEAQKYTGYILNTNTQMQNSSKYTNDATASYSSQIPVVKSLGTTSVATAGNVGLINGAMNNIGKGVSYSAIIAGFSAGLSKDKIGNIGLNNIKNPIESQANLTGSGFNGNNVFSRISGAINYSAYKTPGTNIKNNIESPIQNTGQGLKANQILNYISGQFNAQKWSGIGNNMVKDIVNGFNAINSQMTNSIRALCNGMQSAASSAPWSNIGRTIGQDIKYGLQQIISSFNFNVAVSANGKSYTVNGTARAYFASGGFPEEGTVFVAGEAGAEAVGTINGRTGVANRDQIASAIAMALKPMLGNGGGGTETIYVNTYLDSQVVARANAKGQKAMNRRYNITAKA